jgi:glucose-1-phosphate thymidylyltransferase
VVRLFELSMNGIILAGGNGSRLNEISKGANKHTVEVAGQPMIDYPLQTMKHLGAEPVIVSRPGESFGDYPHVYQELPLGMPDAISKAEELVSDEFYVIAGDVYFDPQPEPADEPTLYWHEFEGANQHSVWNPETNEIVEKPTRDIGSRAIIFYRFDQRVFDVIRHLKPSERGELEMTDIYKWYLLAGVNMKEYKGFFGDMGTPEGLRRVKQHESKR